MPDTTPAETERPRASANAGARPPWTRDDVVQLLVNLAVFAAIAGACARDVATKVRTGRFDFVEVSFALQNAVMLLFILARRRHSAVERSLPRQAVALAAFFSGIAFMGQPATGGALARAVSRGLVLAANLLGIATLLNLGRSFGILIALRKVESRGLYGLVRHPMYGTDILLRVGYVAGHLTPLACGLFVLSTGCYVWRALLEERFLAKNEDYRAYMKRVKCRFIPFLL